MKLLREGKPALEAVTAAIVALEVGGTDLHVIYSGPSNLKPPFKNSVHFKTGHQYPHLYFIINIPPI